VLVLDDLHLVDDPDSIRVVRALADAVPPGSTLALVSRGSTPAWLARFRASGRLQVLTTADLAFDDGELGALLQVLDLDLPATDRDALLRRTEGWAVALYLEALALRQARPVANRPSPEGVGDRAFARDYIEAEVLDPLPPATRDFLLRTSILDQLSVDACDAVLERSDSAAVLEGLRRSTPLVTVLDAERGVYRYHHLLRDTSRALLAAASDATATAGLHGRAAQWYARQGDVDAAVRHASRAGDVEATADLIW
jgi:LuxR family maltose regulon positive regulatory protein